MPIIGVIASSMKGAPGVPTIGTATNVGTGRAYNNGAATVTFTPGPGATATSFTATSSPGGFTGSAASSPITVAGLQSGVSYTFTVTATNASGTSAASSASNSITATTVPQAPTIGTATDGGTGSTVSVAFTAGATGGSAITGFTATSSPGSFTGTGGSSPITVSGLTAGTAYTFTVTATNVNGTSTASAASNSVTPALPAQFDSLATANLAGVATVTISGISSAYNHLVLRWTSQAGNTQTMFVRFNGLTTNIYTGIRAIAYQNNTIDSNNTNAGNSFMGGVVTGNYTTGNVLYIPNYKDTNQQRAVASYFGGRDTLQTNGFGFTGQIANSTAAVSSVTVFIPSGGFTGANTSLSLYGIK